MALINPYLNFNGNTEDAFTFYKAVFGGEFIVLQRFGETPEGNKMDPNDRQKIMHVALPIGQGNILMGTDTLASMGHSVTTGTNLSLSIDTESEAEATGLFEGLAVGGQVTMPLGRTPWGACFGMLTDKFGVQWMVNYDDRHETTPATQP